MICIWYVMIIFNYYDYSTTHHIFWVPWLQLGTIRYDYEYNMIWWSYLIIIIMYSSATKVHNSGAVPTCMCHIWSCRGLLFTPQPYIITSLIVCGPNQLAWGNQSIATTGIQHMPLTTSHTCFVAMNICGGCSAHWWTQWWAQFLILHSFCGLSNVHMVLWTSVCIYHTF